MMSNQLELADADQAYQLAKEAEIKALQAQISPHFLFNTLNTIVSLTRIDPAKARKTLIF
jgi:two-component system sensor histidine kinase LytS